MQLTSSALSFIAASAWVGVLRCVCVCLQPRNENKNPDSSVACRGYVVRRCVQHIMHRKSRVGLILSMETAHSLLVTQHEE